MKTAKETTLVRVDARKIEFRTPLGSRCSDQAVRPMAAPKTVRVSILADLVRPRRKSGPSESDGW